MREKTFLGYIPVLNIKEKTILGYIRVLIVWNVIISIALAIHVFNAKPANIPVTSQNIPGTPNQTENINTAESKENTANNTQNTTAVPANNSEAVTREILVHVNDEGFAPQGLQIYGNENIKFVIENSGSKKHSFTMEEFGVDSGEIDPGSNVEIMKNSVPNEDKNFFFYSTSQDDQAESFKGILMILAR